MLLNKITPKTKATKKMQTKRQKKSILLVEGSKGEREKTKENTQSEQYSSLPNCLDEDHAKAQKKS